MFAVLRHESHRQASVTAHRVKVNFQGYFAVLKHGVQSSEAKWAEREATLRREVLQLESQVHQLEADKADQTAGATEATRPLLR